MDLQARLERYIDDHDVPGAVLGVLVDDEVSECAAGVLNRITGVEVTTDSVFQIGSNTKVWTATQIMQCRRPHLALFCDLDTLLGRDSAGRGPWLRHTGDCDPTLARHLALDATITPILGMGDWRPVALGRTHRVAPAWLRHAMEWIHRHCRGPGCDRPITWTQAAHTGLAWSDGGDTRLDEQMPGCTRHHQLIDLHGWQIHWDHTTNVVTWTSPDRQITVHTRPPPDIDHILRDHHPRRE